MDIQEMIRDAEDAISFVLPMSKVVSKGGLPTDEIVEFQIVWGEFETSVFCWDGMDLQKAFKHEAVLLKRRFGRYGPKRIDTQARWDARKLVRATPSASVSNKSNQKITRRL